jgi:hypothetical protein
MVVVLLYQQVTLPGWQVEARAILGITHVNAASFRLREISMNPPNSLYEAKSHSG